MPWSGITSVVTYSAANAIAIPHPALEPIKVTTTHPGTGRDGIVTFYGSDGKPVATANVSASDPVQTIEFSTASQTLNYSTSAVFASPGLSINVGNTFATESGYPISDYAPMVPRRKRVIIEGDSISSSYPPGQWPHIAAMLDGGTNFVIVYSDSVSATNLEQMAVRIDAIPVSIVADEIWIQGGTNLDAGGSYGPTARNKAAVNSIALKSLARGWKPVFIVPPPLNGSQALLADFGKWLVAWCAYNGHQCVNIWADAVETTGAYKAASTYDGTHPTTAAATSAAKRMLEYIRPGSSITGAQPQIPALETTNSSTINTAINPLCLTNTAGLATGWSAPSGAGSSTATIVAAANPLVGNLQNFVDSYAITQYVMHRRSGTPVIGGHRYLVIDYIKVNSITDGSANGQSVNIQLSAVGNVSGQINWGYGGKPGPSIAHVGAGFVTREILIPANDTQLTLGYYVQSYTNAGSGTIDWSVGQHQVIDLTAAGL